MKTYEALERALALIEDEENWCRCGPGNETDTFCMAAAVAHVVGECRLSPSSRWSEHPARHALIEALGGGYIGEFNDTHSHAEVVALFQKAIRNEKAKAGVPLDVEPEAVPA